MNGQKPFRLAAAAVIAVGALLLGGCEDIQDVTLHEPGVYKGKTDPLLQRLEEPAEQQALEERFRNQMDR
jgi:hypothetical protein